MREGRECIAAVAASALLVAGCATDAHRAGAPEPVPAARVEREGAFNRLWQNHSLRELIDHWGPPQLLLDIPGGGNPPGFVLVYRRDEDSGCLDTFAVTYGDVMRVRLYQCR